MLANCLEHGDDVSAIFSWLDRAAVDEHTWPVDPGHRYCAAWHILVTAADSNKTVKAFSTNDGFYRVCYHFTGHQ